MDNEKDKFIEIVRDKLTNYTIPVDEDSWDKIAKRLNPASPKKAQRVWLAIAAVAASILLLLLLFPINKKTSQTETASQTSGQEKTILQDIPETETVQSFLPQNTGSPKVFKKYQPLKQLAENNLPTEVIPKKEPVEENPLAPAAKKEESKATENHPVSSKSAFNFEEDEQTPVIKHKKSKSIRFTFGSGANLLADNTANMLQNGNNAPGIYLSSDLEYSVQTGAQSQTKNNLSYENYPDVNYHLPLSFGVTVKKELNRTFAIESGIVYTFLSTSFDRSAFPKSSAELRLHYLGIPLNLHTRILGNRVSLWELYLSTGGMVEKGILSHYVQKTYNDVSSVSTTVLNEKINGLQWSVNISPGVDYRIYKNYSIYAEPKFSYYFDNNQPVSVRTKHPVVIGINAGIRYTW